MIQDETLKNCLKRTQKTVIKIFLKKQKKKKIVHGISRHVKATSISTALALDRVPQHNTHKNKLMEQI